MLDKSAFSEAIDYVLQDEGRVTVALVPGVFQLGGGEQPLELRYRPRDRVEAVRRIWAAADTDAMALVAMLREDYDAARLWADFIAVQINADKIVIEQAAQYGVDEARVRATPPFRATVGMIETLARNIQALGSLPAVAHAVAVEWHWARASAVSKERAREALGLEFIKAIAAHPELGQRKDHSTMVIDVAHRLATRRPDGMPLFFAALRQTSSFFRTYFGEL